MTSFPAANRELCMAFVLLLAGNFCGKRICMWALDYLQRIAASHWSVWAYLGTAILSAILFFRGLAPAKEEPSTVDKGTTPSVVATPSNRINSPDIKAGDNSPVQVTVIAGAGLSEADRQRQLEGNLLLVEAATLGKDIRRIEEEIKAHEAKPAATVERGSRNSEELVNRALESLPAEKIAAEKQRLEYLQRQKQALEKAAELEPKARAVLSAGLEQVIGVIKASNGRVVDFQTPLPEVVLPKLAMGIDEAKRHEVGPYVGRAKLVFADGKRWEIRAIAGIVGLSGAMVIKPMIQISRGPTIMTTDVVEFDLNGNGIYQHYDGRTPVIGSFRREADGATLLETPEDIGHVMMYRLKEIRLNR